MSSEKKLDLRDLEKVTGGWNESMLSEQEYARYHEIIDRLEYMKDTGEGTQSEADALIKKLSEFHKEMENKYGK